MVSSRGATLVELLVALAIFAALAGLSVVPLTALRPTPAQTDSAELRRLRTRAIQTGASILVEQGDRRVRFMPDGRVLVAPQAEMTP